MEGKWELAIDTPIGRLFLTFSAQENDGELTGTLIGNNNNVEVSDGKFDDGEATFSAYLNAPTGGSTNAAFRLNVDDSGKAYGTVATSFGAFGVEATKQ